MTKLLDEVRVHLRTTTKLTDVEINTLIDAAKYDIKRVGVRKELVDTDESMSPLVKLAIIYFCKANYGYDNADKAYFREQYQHMVIDLMNSQASEQIHEIVGEGNAME